MTEKEKFVEHMLKTMVDRFLGWPLPKDFGPDCGISFDGRKDDEWNKNKSWPVGTNLFTADQAKEMFKHALRGDDFDAFVAAMPGGVTTPTETALRAAVRAFFVAMDADTDADHHIDALFRLREVYEGSSSPVEKP